MGELIFKMAAEGERRGAHGSVRVKHNFAIGSKLEGYGHFQEARALVGGHQNEKRGLEKVAGKFTGLELQHYMSSRSHSQAPCLWLLLMHLTIDIIVIFSQFITFKLCLVLHICFFALCVRV